MVKKYLTGLLMGGVAAGCGGDEPNLNLAEVEEEAPARVAETICQDLLATEHSEPYLSMQQHCSELGREEDNLYQPRNILLERYRETFQAENPLELLGEEFTVETRNQTFHFSTNQIRYEESQEGSEFNDTDVQATATYTRKAFDQEGQEIGQLDPLVIKASRLTARGKCLQNGLLTDMAAEAAKNNNSMGFGTVHIGNGYAFFSTEKKVWVSGETLIEVGQQQEGLRFSFNDPLLKRMSENSPSDFRCEYNGDFQFMEGGCNADDPNQELDDLRDLVSRSFNDLRWQLYRNNCLDQ
jgi:hypothetical protein